MNTYSSIVPSRMTNSELRAMCAELYTAINWGLDSARVKLSNGMEYEVSTSRLKDYQQAYKTETNETTKNQTR